MFDFEKLVVYQKARKFNAAVTVFLAENKRLSAPLRDQLQRAALSIPLNIAEGSSRYSKADRRNFYIVARGSVFECVAIFDILSDQNLLDKATFDSFRSLAEELSKILFTLINSLSATKP